MKKTVLDAPLRVDILRPAQGVTACRIRTSITLLVVASFLGACQDSFAPESPTGPSLHLGHLPGTGGSSKIAFSSNRDGNYEIYVMDPDGSNQVRLTTSPGSDFAGGWSPDGSRIVFTSERDGDREIFVMDADGTDQTQLTFNSSRDEYPSFSPDGSKLVFTSTRDGVPGGIQLYVMNADGSNQVRISGTESYTEYNFPRWSPASSLIVFDRGYAAGREIFTIESDGSNMTRLTVNGATDVQGSFSPDQSVIAFASDRDGVFYGEEVYIMNADGSGQTRLTGPGQGRYNEYPTFSPDGHSISFTSYRDGRWQVYGMASDGSVQLNLSNSAANDLNAVWSPELNRSPTADAGPDVLAQCYANSGSMVLDGSASTDPDGDLLDYTWRRGGAVLVGVGPNPTVSLPLGAHSIELTVDDGRGATDTDDIAFNVEDSLRPELNFVLDDDTLRVDNKGDLVRVATGVSAIDACASSTTMSIYITSDQHPEADPTTDPDWEIVDNGDGSFDLFVRPEQDNGPGGRTYTITVTATDPSGNFASDSQTVFVSRKKAKKDKK